MASTSDPPSCPDDRPVFPQELFDKLIDSAEVDSPRHLHKFALVSKAWAHRSRRRIFSQVRFTSKAAFELWCKNTAPGPNGPSALVRVLVFSQIRKNLWIHPSILLEGEQHLMSFTNLKGWVVFGLDTLCFEDRTLLSRCFHAMARDLRFVRLHHVRGSPRTLTSLIQQFPTIQTLAIEYYTEAERRSQAEEPIDETSGRFQGILQLLSIELNGLVAIDAIARLPLKYTELALTSSLYHVEPYNRLLLACAPTLERLRIIDTRKPRGHWEDPVGMSVCPLRPSGPHRVADCRTLTVASCTELQMVYLGTSRKPGPMLAKFIQSISPSSIFELAFELIWDRYMNDDIASVIDIPAWEPIDNVLCALARRIREVHPERKLSVILSVVAPLSTDFRKVKIGTLFSGFRGEGTISLQYFIDYMPPVSFASCPHSV